MFFTDDQGRPLHALAPRCKDLPHVSRFADSIHHLCIICLLYMLDVQVQGGAGQALQAMVGASYAVAAKLGAMPHAIKQLTKAVQGAPSCTPALRTVCSMHIRFTLQRRGCSLRQ